jgi:putative sigma-54 modulation protein
MRINVVGRHFEVTDAIREYAEQKAGKLTKYFDGLQQIDVQISHEGHHHGAEYEVELVLDVEKHRDFVSRAKTTDPYAAIDLVVEKGERQLRDFKEKLKH